MSEVQGVLGKWSKGRRLESKRNRKQGNSVKKEVRKNCISGVAGVKEVKEKTAKERD